MREIKFRGYNGMDWVYGSAIINDSTQDAWYMIENGAPDDDWMMVNKVGQYTGLKDKNGKEIYEGDIVNSFMQENKREWNDFEAKGAITYFKDHAQFLIKQENNHLQLGFDLFELGDTEHYEVLDLEVIGNIYDNPELLGNVHENT